MNTISKSKDTGKFPGFFKLDSFLRGPVLLHSRMGRPYSLGLAFPERKEEAACPCTWASRLMVFRL